jgi:hypothetical protein
MAKPLSPQHARRLTTPALLSLSVVLAVVVASCGGEDQESVQARSDPGGGSATEPATEVECGGSVFDLSEFADAPLASSLPDGPAGATDDAGVPAFDSTQDWRVVHQSDERVDLLRELEGPLDNGGGDVRTHESRVLELITGANNIPDGTWLLTSAGPCVPRLLTDSDVNLADLTLPEAPTPNATSIELFVHERACASGADATGRIELVSLQETLEEVLVVIGVRPREGGQDCQGNPPTPFTVELREPLAGRSLLDASVVPPRLITVDDG